jgi:hypothetical protein
MKNISKVSVDGWVGSSLSSSSPIIFVARSSSTINFTKSQIPDSDEMAEFRRWKENQEKDKEIEEYKPIQKPLTLIEVE